MTHGDALREIERLQFRNRMLEGQVRRRHTGRRMRRCSYCGDPCRGAACPSHRDLLALDPAAPR